MGMRKRQRIRIISLMALCLVAQMASITLPAMAGTITFTSGVADQPGKFEGELPIKILGSLKLPSGAVVFQDGQIKVMAVPDWLFDRNVVLSGPLVRAEFAGQGNDSVIAGLAYFLEGEWLTNLASPRAVDVIETLSGERISGRILSSMGSAFAIKPNDGATRKIDFSAIKTINSARAFRFSIPTRNVKILAPDNGISAEADTISFAPTFLRGGLIASRPTVPKSTLPGAEPGISKGTIATFLALDFIVEVAPAIAIPLTLQHKTQEAALRQISLFSTSQQRSQGIPIPLSSNSQGDARYLGPFGPMINPIGGPLSQQH